MRLVVTIAHRFKFSNIRLDLWWQYYKVQALRSYSESPIWPKLVEQFKYSRGVSGSVPADFQEKSTHGQTNWFWCGRAPDIQGGSNTNIFDINLGLEYIGRFSKVLCKIHVSCLGFRARPAIKLRSLRESDKIVFRRQAYGPPTSGIWTEWSWRSSSLNSRLQAYYPLPALAFNNSNNERRPQRRCPKRLSS